MCKGAKKKKGKKSSQGRKNTSLTKTLSSFTFESDLYASCIEEQSERLKKAKVRSSGLDDGENGAKGEFVETYMQSSFERREAKLDIQRRRVKWTEEKYRENHQSKSDKGREKDSYFLSSGGREDGANVPGSILRLRKKDSTRQPRYKDKIMLTDNIDKIIEQEIPEEEDLVATVSYCSETARNEFSMETPLEDEKCTSDPAGSGYTMEASSYLGQRIIQSGMVDII